MEEDILGADLPLPPSRLFERLAQVPRYTWDQSLTPFHSTYDHWHVYGILHNHGELDTPQTTSSTLSSALASSSNRSSPLLSSRPHFRTHWSSISGASTDGEFSSAQEPEQTWVPVMARISTHVIKLEREYKTVTSIAKDYDPGHEHIFKPLEMLKLPATAQDPFPILVCIYEAPGANYLRDVLNFGPAFYGLRKRKMSADTTPNDHLPLQSFLDYAIGACSALELLHHGISKTHGEIRQDAFHWNRDTGLVRLANIGNGPRAFENLLSSNGWAMLSKERGAINKLAYIAPEQTGRLAFEPDSRTDIYSLGVVFWSLLTGRPAFEAETPIDSIQKVLSTRLAPIASFRMDIPDAISQVIQKMTQKQMDERYNSINGLKYDLMEIQRLLGEGETAKISEYKVGQRDVSSFFILPSRTVGHHNEQERIARVIEKVHKRLVSTTRKANQGSNNLYSAASTSSVSDVLDPIDGSDTSSSFGLRESRSNLTTTGLESTPTTGRTNLLASTRGIAETRNASFDWSDRDSQLSGPFATSGIDNLGAIGRIGRRNGYKPKKRSKTEVVVVTGLQGAGKSTILKSMQPQARRFGYFASSRFDKARPTPFEPMLKVLGSLFRQIFSEKDVSTSYHETIRSHVRPHWHVLHSLLDLPDTLLDPAQSSKKVMLSSEGASLMSELTSLESRSIVNGANGTSRDANDFLRGPSSTKSIRLINTYVDVLRLLCSSKVICLSLDDVQAADDESLGLVDSIVRARIPVILLLARRVDSAEESPKVRNILEYDRITTVELGRLREKHVFEYVAATMTRDVDAVIPLAAVVHEKSAGNPFMMKEILQTLYARNCLWYDWRMNGWMFDLDKIFDELATEDQLGTEFLVRKFAELPQAAQCVLSWGSLIGNTFSLRLIQKLLHGDFLNRNKPAQTGDGKSTDVTCRSCSKFSSEQTVDGLNLLLNKGIVISGENDDEYSFAHTRYLTAAQEAANMSGKAEEMHFILSQAMLSYLSSCRYSLYPLARHICLGSVLIKQRIVARARHRDVLWRAAGKATESGAGATALWYYETCMSLLQDDPWSSSPDSFYEETLQIHVSLAEVHHESGNLDEATRLLDEVFKHARCSADKTRAYLLQARILNKKGQPETAFSAVKTCLADLGVVLEDRTWSQLDAHFRKLELRLRSMDQHEFVTRPLSEERSVVALGTVLSEAVAFIYWYDVRLWMFLVMTYTETVLDQGMFVQAGLGFNMLGAAAVSRYKDVELGLLYGDIASALFGRFDHMAGLGWTLYCQFLGHTRIPVRNMLPVLENALDLSLASGGRSAALLNLGCMASTRFWAGQDLSEIEAFCSYSPEEFKGWENDLRGGTVLIAIRQLCRALQGKTHIENVETLLDDSSCREEAWITMCKKNKITMTRSMDMWKSLTIPAYYVLGHHEKVIEIGRRLVATTLDELLSHRAVAQLRFYLALSLLAVGKHRSGSERQEITEEVILLKQSLESWTTVNDVNYFVWIKLIEAELADLTRSFGNVISYIEAAIDHCQVHGLAFEEAIAMEIGAEFLAARGAKRPAKVMVQEAVAAWNRISAVAKSSQLAAKHEWLIKTATTGRTQDAGIQTETIASPVGNDDPGLHIHRDYTSKWVEPKVVSPAPKDIVADVPGLGLDILDLTAILEFSKVISSELQINSLLKKMTEVILECVAGAAEFAAVVIESDTHGWAVAASGDHDQGVRIYEDGIKFEDIDDVAVQQITHYILRTKETVFLPNVLEDERFGNVSDTYLKRNPNGRSIMCLPIIQSDHLMGVIHLEGRPNAFTQRNLVVLSLLSNQVGISLGNALLYRKVRKVSAANAAMVEAQKRALAQAREAEAKAKEAEAEAMHNVKLKEEAMKAKSLFLSNISHELRTPLNGVIGMSELLKGTELTKDQEGYADSIRVCADTLLTVINDILDYSKLEAGKMQLFTVPLNLKETIKEVIRALAYTNHERGLETIEELDLDDDLIVKSDSIRIHQIFMNLLSNAYKFTPKGSITVKAKVTAESREKVKITCAVADTGIGITKEQLTRLFQPFSQADSSTARSYGGSGLGLSICKAMIETVLGGKIWIESKPGEGTTVFFQLTFYKASKNIDVPHDNKIATRAPDPMAEWSRSSSNFSKDREEAAETPASTEQDRASISGHLRNIPREDIRICIAEDNPVNRKVAIGFVTKLGIQCDAYEDGKLAYEALQKASEDGKPYHIVLMDVQMPVLDGYNATKAIRKDQDLNVRDVLIIAMTASAIRGDREKCLEAGMNDYLAKPVRQAALKAMLDEYLNDSPRSRSQVIRAEMGATPTLGDRIAREVKGAANPAQANGDKTKQSEQQEQESTDASVLNDPAKMSTEPQSMASSTVEKETNPSTADKPEKRKRSRIALKGSKRHPSFSESMDSQGTVTGPSSSTSPEANSEVSSSPPSGVQEAALLGRVSTEVTLPPANGPTKEEISQRLAQTPSEKAREEKKSSEQLEEKNKGEDHKEDMKKSVNGDALQSSTNKQ